MKPAELAALGLRLAALVLQIKGVLWSCAFVATLFISIYTIFGNELSWSLTLNIATGIPAGAYLLLAWYFRRRATTIVACPPADEVAVPDRRTAEIFVAVAVAWGAFTIVEPLRMLMVEWRQYAEYSDLFDVWEDASGWRYRLQLHAFDIGAALVCLFGATYIVRCALWMKKRRAPMDEQIEA